MSTIAADPAYAYAAIEAELATYLGLGTPPISDTRVELWYDSAVAWADKWLAYDWTDDDGADIPKPDIVKLALFEGVLAIQGAARKARGVTKVATGSLSEEYGGTPLNLASLAGRAMAGLIGQWKANVWLRGTL